MNLSIEQLGGSPGRKIELVDTTEWGVVSRKSLTPGWGGPSRASLLVAQEWAQKQSYGRTLFMVLHPTDALPANFCQGF